MRSGVTSGWARTALRLLAAVLVFATTVVQAFAEDLRLRRYLYVASPGVRNYTEYGGVGVLVFDRDDGYRFVRRISTFEVRQGTEPENVKGICASARTSRLYVSTIRRVLCLDLRTDRKVWERAYQGGCDRLALSPDGKTLYIPSLEGSTWTVADALTGDVKATLRPDSGAHNTIYGSSGKWCYLAGLKSRMLNIADTSKHTVGKQTGPFGEVIRPFTIDAAEARVYVNVNDLLGFEVGDLHSGKVLARVEVAGYKQGPTKRHGCPSHGVALTPDEKELWLTDAYNERLHLFDATVMPPRQTGSIKLRDQPGWITFSLDGQHAYPSTGEVIETKTRRILTTLEDEEGRAVQSEKMLEIQFRGEEPVAAGDQFGIGRKKARRPRPGF